MNEFLNFVSARYFVIILLYHVSVNPLYAQNCNYQSLSKQFNYKISISKKKDRDGFISYSKIVVKVFNKKDGTLFQELLATSESLYSSSYSDCSNVRSYLTGVNKNAEVADGDYGNFIVCDFNFDNKEDVALLIDTGGKSGPMYKFYTRQNNNRFKEDIFLSEKVRYFPNEIDKKTKTITTLTFSMHEIYLDKFKFNSLNQKWHQLSSETHEIEIDENNESTDKVTEEPVEEEIINRSEENNTPPIQIFE